MGFSIRPPPAMIPIIARQEEETDFFLPEGSLRVVRFSSGLCETTVANFPEARAKAPRSPVYNNNNNNKISIVNIK
jgi:hypothetical protein